LGSPASTTGVNGFESVTDEDQKRKLIVIE